MLMDSVNATSVSNLAILSFLAAGVTWISISGFQSSPPHAQLNASGRDIAAAAEDELGKALRRAATVDGTVIIAVVNKAYVAGEARNGDAVAGPTMLDLFLESFWLGKGTRRLLEHLLVVAMDGVAYERCKFRRLHCFRLDSADVDFGGEQLYMSSDFIRMMWRRTLFLSEVLERGYNFVFTDCDVMWLRNPFPRLTSNRSEDVQMSTDEFDGDPRSEANFINTGFYYARSNNRTIALFHLWYASQNNSHGKKEQDVLADLIRDGAFRALCLKVRFLDTAHFSGFCQDSTDLRAVTTVHANCCRSISAKVADLSAVLRHWKFFRRHRSITVAGNNGTAAVAVPWYRKHVGCFKSWGSSRLH